MTIYTPGKLDKDPKDVYPEVVTESTEPLTCSKKDDCEAAVSTKQIRVTYSPKNRRTCCVRLLLCVIGLIILIFGVIGSVFFYNHVNKRTYSGVCGIKYYDDDYSELRPSYYPDADPYYYNDEKHEAAYLKEEMEVSPVDEWEYFHTQPFDDVRATTVWHDFRFNYTAIVDEQLGRCHIMPLNRTAIAPPTSILDLIEKMITGYYFETARVTRHDYRIKARITDFTPYGTTVQDKCSRYDSFLVEKVGRVIKRSTATPKVYALLSNQLGAQIIHKISII